MADWEKVIKGLEYCIDYAQRVKDLINDVPCAGCPYVALKPIKAGQGDCIDVLFKDTLALLKAQEPRVMTLSEMNDKHGRGEAVYYEDRDATCKSQDVFVIAPDKDLDVVWLKAETYTLAAKMSTMGKTWRCWTARPTDEQREAEPWNT